MPLTTGAANFADAMKTYYIGPLNDQVEKAHVMLDRLEKTGIHVEGNFAYMPLITARNPAVGSRKDVAGVGPTLPDAGKQGYGKVTFPMAYHYGRGSISGPVMRASKSKSGAFAQALDIEMKGLAESLPEDLNRQVWSYGHGRGATIADTNNNKKTLAVHSRAIMSLKIGDRVHITEIAGGASFRPAAGTTVAAINRDQNTAAAASTTLHTIVLTAATAKKYTAGTDAIYFGTATAVALADSSQAQEMYGIPAAIDDGAVAADEGEGATTVAGNAAEFISASVAYGGVNRAVSAGAYYRSQVLKNPNGAGTNRALTVALMEKAFLTGAAAGGAAEQSYEIFSNPGLWATFGLLHIGSRVFNDFKETLKGGWIALMFNNRPFLYDRDCQRDIIWFLDMSTLKFLTQSGYEMMDDDGAVLHRIDGKDAYEFTLYRDCQLGCNNASKSVRLCDLIATYQVEYDI